MKNPSEGVKAQPRIGCGAPRQDHDVAPLSNRNSPLNRNFTSKGTPRQIDPHRRIRVQLLDRRLFHEHAIFG